MTRTFGRSVFLLTGLMVGGMTALAAQDVTGPITPDRPGLGDGAHVVGQGVVQLETGLDYSRSGGDPFTVGPTLVRVGLGAVELRLFPGAVVIEDAGSGLADPAVGLKVRLSDADAPVRLSTVLATSLPIGSDRYGADDFGGGVTLVGEGSLTETVGLAINVGYSGIFNALQDGTLALIVTPGVAVPGVDGLGLYGGWAGLISDGRAQHFVESGLAYAVNADTQLDLNFGYDVARDGDVWFVGAGVAVRWR